MSAVVGAARVTFGADTSDFDRGANRVQATLRVLVDKFESVQRAVRNVGAGLTIGITVPLGLMARAVDKTAGDFEKQMKNVEAALDGVTGEQLKQLSDQARTMGPAVGKSATEAAATIEALGLQGMATADILGGGLQAALNLATAGMAEGADAASLVGDVMGQFKKTAADLPVVVTNVVGALDASKFGFEDFRLAIGQGGAVAAASGVSFSDFATSIAATSSQFSSGADAGTSFKTYLQSLVGSSDQAKSAMKKLGLQFFDANGRMKPLGEQAQMLRDKLGDLTDASKTEALKTIFGSDAARTAIGLMEQGRAGFEKLQATIAGGDVEAKIAKRMEGSAAASTRIANAWESVKISIGETGLLDLITGIKNGFARMLEAFANAPRAVHLLAAAFAGLGLVIGPILTVIGTLAVPLLARFVSTFGMIGRIVSLIISPISTIIGMLGEAGLARVLSMVASRMLAFLGPVGIAIGLFLTFKDHIIAALQSVWQEISTSLGPPVAAIFDKFGAIFAKLSGGPVGSGIAWLMDALGALRDFIGTGLQAGLMIVGEVIERTLGVIIAAIGGVVDVVSGIVDAISALLSGDFAGAWDAVVGLLENVFGTIIDMAAALVPEFGGEMRAVYEAAKTWLADGFAAVGTWVSTAVAGMVNFVAGAFPGIVDAAKSVYNGVKGWLVDKFGWLLGWVSKAAAFIGNVYGKLKEKLGLGVATATADPQLPAKPPEVKAPPAPKRTVDLGGDEKKKGAREKKGRDTQFDAGNREQLQEQAELEAARIRGDLDAVRAIEDRLDLSKQIEAYKRTGLATDKATAAAQRDMATIQAARAANMGRELGDQQRAHEIEIARLDENQSLAQSLERQAEVLSAIRGFQRDGLTLVQATTRATQQQIDLDAARARVRERWIADDAQRRGLDLARSRGESDETIRRMEREIDVRDRARRLEKDAELSPADALAQATREWEQQDAARVQGVFRSTFRDGIRAAMDGDLSSFVKDWWRQRVAKGMEEAINSLADLVQRLFASIKIGGQDGGAGGLLGSVAKLFGAVGTKAPTTQSAGAGLSSIGASIAALPKFNTGGSFKVGGMSGIDRNIVSMRLTKGEMVDIRKPGNDNGGAQRVEIVPSKWFDVRAAEAAQPGISDMGMRAAEGGSRLARADAAKRGRRRITR